jgi:predicted nuclease of predicted toxin-antitoxin system
MKILFEQGVPVPLRKFLTGLAVSTAFENGWSELANGELLEAAESRFDVFVTTDQNLKYQQNLSGRHLSILILPTTNWPRLKDHTGLIVQAIGGLSPSDFVELRLP